MPCGPINTIDQVFADPQVRHLGLAQGVRSHERGDVELVGQPIIMSRTPSPHPHAAAARWASTPTRSCASSATTTSAIAALRAAAVI